MKWLVAVVAVEAIVEILVHSPLFEWLRKFASRNRWTNELVGCGWCLSVWVATLAVVLVLLGWWVALVPFAVSRAANVFHEIYGRLRHGGRIGQEE